MTRLRKFKRGLFIAAAAMPLIVGWSPRFGWSAERASAPDVAIARPASESTGHHQAARTEIAEGDAARTITASAGRAHEARRGGSGEATIRFLAGCMTRLHFDEPLGTEQAHRAFCTCRVDALSSSGNAGALAAVAANLEARNALETPPLLPAVIDRSNQAAITTCMPELSR
jgi:hypothetical protein